MKTQEFLDLLKDNQGKSLLFEYAPNTFVGANYHITEVKNISIESVDCGAGQESWDETIIQLWESPTEVGKTDYMSAYKALSILKKVDRIKSMVKDAEVKFEYGNGVFHTTQLYVNQFQIHNQNLIIHLAVNATDCKAKEACGLPDFNIESQESCCSPSTGCC